MQCQRCAGWMCRTWMSDGTEWELMWKCLNCGRVLDAIVMINEHRVDTALAHRRGHKRQYDVQ
ncbi:hypothetical protein HOO68_05975 [Candidatus Gracilibacteria bacterium]|nr:hypothetical protein [Candidatus Gracilibacteria bacterium]